MKALAFLKAWATSGLEPALMGLGPIPAVRKTLSRAALTLQEIDLVESNEAFAAKCLAVSKELEIPAEITIVNGGAIALGHPIGASGARITVTLLHEMQKLNSRLGLATLCIDGGMGTALIVENITH